MLILRPMVGSAGQINGRDESVWPLSACALDLECWSGHAPGVRLDE